MIQQPQLEMFRYVPTNDMKFLNNLKEFILQDFLGKRKKTTTKDNFIPNVNSFWLNLTG